MMTLILIGIFLTELIKYGVWFRGIQGLRFKRLGLGCALAGSYVLLILMGVVDVETLLLVYSIVAVAVCGMMLECRKGRLIYVLQSYFFALCLNEAIAILVRLHRGRLLYGFEEIKISYLLNNIIVVCVFGVWMIVRTVKRLNEKCEHIWQMIIQVVIIVISFVVFFVISGFQNTAEYIEDAKIGRISMLMSMISFLILACLIILISYIFSQNEKYKMYLEKDKLIFQTQKKMYETMLNKNKEIKSFKHDMHNHLMCLEELINLGDLDKVKGYVEGMEGKLKSNQNRVYMVGNDVVDAVLNYYISLLDNNVKVMIEGECPRKIKMNDVELCAVVSNLIQNATEALNQLELKEKILKIEFLYNKGYFSIQIKNTILNINLKRMGEKNRFITTKKNKEMHGIGICNAEETLKKNGGMLKFEIMPNEFVATAMIPME